MTDRPILFSAPMVQGLLAGRKTQTRREIKSLLGFGRISEFGRSTTRGYDWHFRDKYMRWNDLRDAALMKALPFAKGDRLWVREAWRTLHANDCLKPSDLADDIKKITYEADPENRNPLWAFGKLRPGMFMPRWASRLTLVVESVRVERLQDISAEDALAEGVDWESADPPFYYVPGIWPHSLTAVGVEERGGLYAERSYFKLWNYINGPSASERNPWVMAVSFAVARRNIDRVPA